MNDSPASILFNVDGYEISRKIGEAILAGLVIGGQGNIGFEPLNLLNGSVLVSTKPSRAVLGRYFVGTGLINGSAAAQTLLTIENPIGSSRVVYVNYVDVNGLIGAASSTPFIHRIARLTGLPSGGTVLPSEKRKTTDTGSVAIIRQSPTATAVAGNIWTSTPGTNNAAGTALNRPKDYRSFITDLEDHEIQIQPGEALGVLSDANAIGWRHFVNIRWSES